MGGREHGARSPEEGSAVKLYGHKAKVTGLTVNGQSIGPDRDGAFDVPDEFVEDAKSHGLITEAPKQDQQGKRR